MNTCKHTTRSFNGRTRRRLLRVAAAAVIVLVCLIAFADDREMADLYNEAGVKALKDGDAAKAIEQFKKALKRYPAHPDSVVRLGNIYSAALDTSALIGLYNDWLKAFKGLARPTEKQVKVSKKLKSMLDDLKKLENIDRKFSKKFVSLGRSLRRKDKDAATKAFEKALEIDPGNSAAAREYKKLAGGDFKPSKKSAGPAGKKDYELGALIISEDYAKPIIDWFQDNLCWFENGRYVMQSEPSYAYTSRFGRNFKPSEFYMEVEIQLSNRQNNDSAGGFLFHWSEDCTSYLFMITYDGKFGVWANTKTGKKDFTGKDKGPPDKFTCSVFSKHIKKGKAKNLLAVARVGNKIYCYVNKKQIFACEDSTLSRGRVGFMLNPGSKYMFDNFKVYEVIAKEGK